jgi:hypothetical protein
MQSTGPHPDPNKDAAAAQRLDTMAANLASLNEIVMELVDQSPAADDPFAATARHLLTEHSHALGFKFQGS